MTEGLFLSTFEGPSMARPSEDDREAVDRAFAEMIAGYHHTAERPERLQPAVEAADVVAEPELAPVEPPHVQFRFVEPEPPAPAPQHYAAERYVPEPLPPLRRPGIPALLGWVGIGFAVLTVLAAAFGAPLPTWAGWLAVCGFIVGFAILVSQLPRTRPPDAGDGAVL
jgi:hypothetical protein